MTEFQGTKVLDHGFVYLESVMATDLQVVNSARVSFGKRSNYIQVGHEEGHAVMGLADSDAGLINFLLKNRHGELGFNLGNCVKYIARAGKKDPETHVQDLEKAQFYLAYDLSLLKGERDV